MKKTVILLVLFFSAQIAWACSAAGDKKHVGTITAIDNKQQTFTIRDAETRKAITFAATSEILADLKKAKGRIMVSYEEDIDGELKAVGISF